MKALLLGACTGTYADERTGEVKPYANLWVLGEWDSLRSWTVGQKPIKVKCSESVAKQVTKDMCGNVCEFELGFDGRPVSIKPHLNLTGGSK